MKDKKNTIIVGVLITAVILITVTWAVLLTVKKNTAVTKVTETISTQQSGIGSDEITEEFLQKGAVTAATELFNNSVYLPEGVDSYSTILEEVENDDYTNVSKDLLSQIRLVGDMDTADEKANVVQSLIILGNTLKDNNSLSTTTVAWKYVQADTGTNTAYVPLTVFGQDNTYFNLEMVYVDGEWFFYPYSFMNMVKFSAAVSEEGQ